MKSEKKIKGLTTSELIDWKFRISLIQANLKWEGPVEKRMENAASGLEILYKQIGAVLDKHLPYE